MPINHAIAAIMYFASLQTVGQYAIILFTLLEILDIEGSNHPQRTCFLSYMYTFINVLTSWTTIKKAQKDL